MNVHNCVALLLAAGVLVAGAAQAQQNFAVPEKMPNSTPYGAPITMQKAQDAMQAAIAEANRRGWQMVVAVVDSGANLVTFARMDGAQLGSIAVAEHKARAAVRFRRQTRAFDDAAQKSPAVLSLDDAIASPGGIPLIEQGKIIGGIGCSGGAGVQDEVVCAAGAATIK